MVSVSALKRGFGVSLVALTVGCDGSALMRLLVRGEPPGDDVSSALVPGRARLRLLNAFEYRNTVRDLLSVETSAAIPLGAGAGGFDTGADGVLDENTFALLAIEAERLAAAYVNGPLREQHPCFDPAIVDRACVEKIVSRLSARAWRRPLSDDERERLLADFDRLATAAGDRALATEFLVARLLLSPEFLYRREVGATGDVRQLGPFERASLVAYTVAGTLPDDALLAAAARGELDEPEGVRAQVRRLLATSSGRARVVDFVKQWLRAGALDAMAQNPSAYPKLASPQQAQALRDELARFVESVIVDGSGTLGELLGASHTFVDRHNAPLYGLTVEGDEVWRVSLDRSQRRGLLTLAPVMAVHGSPADPTKDRPVKRGLLLLNRLRCAEVGPPSGIDIATAAANAAKNADGFDELTVREQLEAMMEQGEACRSCHRAFMPLGYAFGHYDALGRHVTERRGRPIDAAVTVDWGGEAKLFAGAVPLIDALAADPATARCFAQALVTYAIGEVGTPHAQQLARELGDAFAESGHDVRFLIEQLASAPQLYVRAP